MNRLDERLDETDRKLVAILQAHGRKPTASIARDLNLSRTAVQARIARLERDGIILGYSANLAVHTGGNVAAMVMLRLSVRRANSDLADFGQSTRPDSQFSTCH